MAPGRATALVLAAALALCPGRASAAEEARAPSIEHAPMGGATAGQPLRITAVMKGPSGIFDPRLYVRRAGEQKWVSLEMLEAGNGLFVSVVPAELVKAGELEYFLEAYDQEGNGPSLAGSRAEPMKIAVEPPVELPPAPPPPPPPEPTPTDLPRAEPPQGASQPALGPAAGSGAQGAVGGLAQTPGAAPAPEPESPRSRVLTWSLVGAGVVGAVVTGAVIGYQATHREKVVDVTVRR